MARMTQFVRERGDGLRVSSPVGKRKSKFLIAFAVALAVGLLSAAVSSATFPVGTDGKIAFRQIDAGGNSDIWVMNPDGRGRRDLTNSPDPVDEDSPAFSPTGREIVFHRSGIAG